MTVRGDLAAGLRGAVLLSGGRADAIRGIGETPRSVRVSLVAALICLPIFLALHAIDWRVNGRPPHPTYAGILQVEGFVIGWAGFLLASRGLMVLQHRLPAWPRVASVWNWINVAQYTIWLISLLPALFGAGTIVVEVSGLVALGWALLIEWSALRLVPGLTPWLVAGLMTLDVGIGLSIDLAVTALSHWSNIASSGLT